jgi:hypothetical protein
MAFSLGIFQIIVYFQIFSTLFFSSPNHIGSFLLFPPFRDFQAEGFASFSSGSVSQAIPKLIAGLQLDGS